jgi:hypothetical protein
VDDGDGDGDGDGDDDDDGRNDRRECGYEMDGENNTWLMI